MIKSLHRTSGKLNPFELGLHLTMLVVFTLLECIAPPSALQPLVSLLIGVPLLAILLAKKLVTKYAVLGLLVLMGAFILGNAIWMSAHVTTGWVDSKSPWSEVDRLLDGRFSGAALLAVDGKVTLEKGYSYGDRNRLIPNTPTTQFMIGSMTKQFTALGVLILRDRGELQLDDPICRYLPDCPQAWNGVSIYHLLTHSSGIIDTVQGFDPQASQGMSIRRLQGALKFLRSLQQPADVSTIIDENKNIPLEFQPGEKFKYSNLGYMLLGYIIESVSGKNYGDFIREEIFIPLEMSRSGYGNRAPGLATGYINSWFKTYYMDISRAHAAGGLYSTIDDLYKWDQSLYSEKLVKKETLAELFAPRISTQNPAGLSYAYGWVVGQANGHPVTMHGGSIGGYLSYIIRYPQDRITIILLSNDQSVDFGALVVEIDKKLGLK